MKNSYAHYYDNKKLPLGDPFVLRFNGKYYIYISTEHNKVGVSCLVSEDLINFEGPFQVCDDPVTKNAYAPEVILYNDKFYLATSPGGNGHYIFTSSSPLGPFKRITDNIQNMIDGSFILDKDNQLYFVRAAHGGIALSKMDENGQPSERIDLNAPCNGWTEGPSILYRDNYYYLTYCGNHLFSPGYRVCYGVAESLKGPYVTGLNNPLLVSTKKDYQSLGHNSLVLGPDLDTYYIAYHHLFHKENDEGKLLPTRNMSFDRLYFSGAGVYTSATNYEIDDPLRPLIEEHLDTPPFKKFVEGGDFLLSKDVLPSKFTAEYNFKGQDISLIFSYQNENEYYQLCFNDGYLSLFSFVGGNKILLGTASHGFNMNHFHSIRIINDKKLEILIDNALVYKTNPVPGGKFGYRNSKSASKLGYIAGSPFANGSSSLNYAYPLPGVLLPAHRDLNETHDSKDNLTIYELNTGDVINFNTVQEKKKNMLLFALINNCDDITLNVSTSQSNKEVIITSSPNEYKYTFKYLTLLTTDVRDKVTIKVIHGSARIKLFKVDDATYKSFKNTTLDGNGSLITTISDNYYLTSQNVSEIKVNFEFPEHKRHQAFGVLANVSNLSLFPDQVEFGFNGYFIGFRNHLLCVEHCAYGYERIYDVPLDLKVGTIYELKVVFNNSLIEVFIDGKLIISTTLKYFETSGLAGIYVNAEAGLLNIENFIAKENYL